MNRLVCSLLLSLLTSCSVFSGDDAKNQPTKLTYSMVTTNTVNPNASGDATPVEIQVFELEDDSMFLAASLEQLVTDAEKSLKSNYINHRNFILTPSQFKFIDKFTIDDETSYIGVMAIYGNANVSNWKKVVKVMPFGRQYHLLMYFNGNDVKLDKVE